MGVGGQLQVYICRFLNCCCGGMRYIAPTRRSRGPSYPNSGDGVGALGLGSLLCSPGRGSCPGGGGDCAPSQHTQHSAVHLQHRYRSSSLHNCRGPSGSPMAHQPTPRRGPVCGTLWGRRVCGGPRKESGSHPLRALVFKSEQASERAREHGGGGTAKRPTDP